MVINISVQYSGGFLRDIVLLAQSWLEHHVVCLKKNQNTPRPSEHPPVLSLMEYYIASVFAFLVPFSLTSCC